MVFYECVMTAKNTAAFNSLTKLMKDVSHKIVIDGGIVRSIQNHGIRELPHRFRAKYPDRYGNRYYEKGRFISMFYDASPATMRQVESMLALNEEILRNTHLKARNKLWYVNIGREDKNPYIQQVLAIERKEAREKAKQASTDDEGGTKDSIEQNTTTER